VGGEPHSAVGRWSWSDVVVRRRRRDRRRERHRDRPHCACKCPCVCALVALSVEVSYLHVLGSRLAVEFCGNLQITFGPKSTGSGPPPTMSTKIRSCRWPLTTLLRVSAGLTCALSLLRRPVWVRRPAYPPRPVASREAAEMGAQRFSPIVPCRDLWSAENSCADQPQPPAYVGNEHVWCAICASPHTGAMLPDDIISPPSWAPSHVSAAGACLHPAMLHSVRC
jgi:hypothetical protein